MDETTNSMSLADYYAAIKAEHDSNNAWSAEQAQKAMDYQKEMSNTAHQREVADLKAAGLNPVLSAGGSGATTGSGIAAARSDENVQALYGLVKESLKANMAQANAMQNTAKYITSSHNSSAGSNTALSSSLDDAKNNVLTALNKISHLDSTKKREADEKLLDKTDKTVADVIGSFIPGVSGNDVYQAMKSLDDAVGIDHFLTQGATTFGISNLVKGDWSSAKKNLKTFGNKLVKWLGL